jgi:hypothetical protein
VLDLPIRAWVDDGGPVHPNVIIIPEIQELLPGELGAIIGDDGVWDPKTENNVLDKIHHLFGVDLYQGSCLNPLSELVDRNMQVGQVIGCFLEWS